MNWRKLFGLSSHTEEIKERRLKKRDVKPFKSNLGTEELLDSIQLKPNVLIEEKKLIPTLNLKNIDWNKTVLLIMDDEELVNYFLEQDLKYFQTIALKQSENINLNKNEEILVSLAKLNNLTDFLFSFSEQDYTTISVSSEYAAFAIRRNIKDIKRIDYAILDISLGGTLNSVDGSHRECLNGIDVAYDISKLKPSPKYMIYTGNDLGKYSPETLQFEELLPNIGGLFKHLVNKDTSLVIRRLKLLGFLADRDFNSLHLD